MNRLHERLTKLGFEILQSEIFTSLSATKQVIKRDSLRPLLFLEDAALEEFKGQQCKLLTKFSIVVTSFCAYFSYILSSFS